MALGDPNRTWQHWIDQYSLSHRHPINIFCHKIGIPMIILSIICILPALFINELWWLAIGLFVIGWIFQFVGHYFERKAPEFLQDWRFLFVGARWWLMKVKMKNQNSSS